MQRVVLRVLLGIAFGRQQSKIEDEDEFEDDSRQRNEFAL
jgi:hypothetical protein